MRRNLPNQVTVLRLILAGVFFLLLNGYRYGIGPTWMLWTAIGVFIAAALSDWLDGYLARRWQAESTFGRIMDPFCDKVLVLGAFIYLAGPRFVIPEAVAEDRWLTMVSGVYPWMVAVMLARELLVTGIRGELEGKGVQFGAKLSGKLKATLQLAGIPFLLFFVFLDPQLPGRAWIGVVRDVLANAIVLVTVVSGLPYITSAIRSMRRVAG